MTDVILFRNYIGVESCRFIGLTANKSWTVVCTLCSESYKRESAGDWQTIVDHWKAKHPEELTMRRLDGPRPEQE